ncbi:hypothetical protein [Streptomyces sp. TRM70350]|uniref:hypothetical protein n=1 Tax=Streptomyces sp. TRM70350 TaxID=2856165 RepID=UPI001C49787D|nr:hypothetical protein [Streptomyces sp. TRM70350]MBV7697727.1 hypothetical protein [Streptomyces sp. TRM70350]
MTAYKPKLHETVEDTATRKVGRVMGFEGPYVQLRPLGGGVEWDAKPETLKPVTVSDGLSAAVAAANARSRGELP